MEVKQGLPRSRSFEDMLVWQKAHARVLALVVALAMTSPAMADGIDLFPYLMRTGWGGIWDLRTLATIVVIMLANYALNIIVIGIPATRTGQVKGEVVMTSLIWLTLLGQVADRIGAVVALVIATPLLLASQTNWGWILLGLNLLTSGVAVGALAFYFVRKKWHVDKRPSWVIAIAAGILTNPAWALWLWSI